MGTAMAERLLDAGYELVVYNRTPAKAEPLLRDDFSATFTTALMEKDIDLILDAAEQAGVELPLANEMKALLRAACEAGYADDDLMALFLHLRSASRYSDQEVVR